MITEEHIKKLKEGRQKHLEENQGLVCRIDDKIEIWADRYQYILKINGHAEGYFSDIISILNELADTKIKQLMLANEDKNLKTVKQAIEDTREWLEKTVKPLLYPESTKPIS